MLNALASAVNVLAGHAGSATDHAATKGTLRSAGVIALSGSTITKPRELEDPPDLALEDEEVPEAPTLLKAYLTTSSLAMLTWTLPTFQYGLSHSEVWELSAPAFNEVTDYVIGDFCTYSGTVYIFTSNHTAGGWAAGDVLAAVAGDLITDNATTIHRAEVSTANIPIDVSGTSYFWVRLVSTSGVTGDFSSSTAVSASSAFAFPTNTHCLIFKVHQTETTPLVGGATLVYGLHMPYDFDLIDVRLSVTTAPVGQDAIIDVNQNGTTIFTTRPHIDDGEKSSFTSSTPGTLSVTSLSEDDLMTVDIDQAGTTTSGGGLKVVLIGARP
jgi:hypothetical protein